MLIYGAYGYTGRLIALEAVRRGLRPILSGRDPDRLATLARETGLDAEPCALSDGDRLHRLVRDAGLVIHAAGPFAVTSAPMADACIATGAHYLDVTGETLVFEALAARGQEAADAGVMLLPGAGFDVVPSDCLAAHLKERLPTANRLSLAISGTAGVSRGTATTMVLHAGHGGAERVDGRLVKMPVGLHERKVDFGSGPRTVISIPWGDLATAWRSTGIPNIRCYAAYPRTLRRWARRSHWFGPILRSRPAQVVMRAAIGRMPPGPDAQARETGRSYVWGEVTDPDGNRASAVFEGPEGYALTAWTAVDLAVRAAAGAAEPGFRTPSQLLGADYALEIPGSVRRGM